MIIEKYDHRCGSKVVPHDVLEKTISVFADYQNKVQKSNVAIVKPDLKEKLMHEGWSDEYRLDVDSKITITSFQQNIGLCFQTGNVGRVYADLLKLQTLFVKGNIIAGVLIVPMKSMVTVFGSNSANFERVVKELPIFEQVITMPLVVVGFAEGDE